MHITETQKKREREREQPKHLKNKKKQKKLVCLKMNKNLSSSSKNSLSFFFARGPEVEKNGPLLRGAKRGEDEQKQRGDQRTLRITRKSRPETRRREIRVRGFEREEEHHE